MEWNGNGMEWKQNSVHFLSCNILHNKDILKIMQVLLISPCRLFNELYDKYYHALCTDTIPIATVLCQCIVHGSIPHINKLPMYVHREFVYMWISMVWDQAVVPGKQLLL